MAKRIHRSGRPESRPSTMGSRLGSCRHGGHVSHGQRQHSLLGGQPVELVEDTLEKGQVLGSVLREILRMPPEMEDATVLCRLAHPRLQPGQSYGLEAPSARIERAQEGA